MTVVIRAVIFDLDGVLRRWPPRHTRSIERRAAIPVGSIDRMAFEPGLLHRAITGEVPDSSWREAVAERLEAAHGRAGREAAAAWARLHGEVHPDLLRLLRDVRRVARVALLTNATSRLGADLAALGLGGEFDAVINSSEVGVAKPDATLFVTAAMALDVALSECAVVDDDAGTVAAARSLGMAGVRHRRPGATRHRLAALGIVGLD